MRVVACRGAGGYGGLLIIKGEQVDVRGGDDGRAEVWTGLYSCWVARDVDGIVRALAGMSREDVGLLLEDLRTLTSLVADAKEVL